MSAECPCGRPAVGCEYHDPRPTQAEPMLVPDVAVLHVSSTGCATIRGTRALRVGDRVQFCGKHGTVTSVSPALVFVLDGAAARDV